MDELAPDVVLMDIRMPELDGVEATRRIFAPERAAKRPTPVRVVVLTTFNLDDRAATAIRHGASGFLLKDTTPLQLAEAIRTVHAGNAVLAVAPGAPSALSPLTGKGLPLAALDGRLDPADIAGLKIDVVAFSGIADDMKALRAAVAHRDGPIVPRVSEVLYPAAYAHERAVCVDTTAAGGNASLLAAA